MPEYDIKFAQKLAEVASGLVKQGLDSPEARRTVTYLCRLSMEISLKSHLEKSGVKIEGLVKIRHNLSALLSEIEKHQYKEKTSLTWQQVSNVRAIKVPYDLSHILMGDVIDAQEKHQTSVYPNEIRYGDNSTVKDVIPEILAPAAILLASWVIEHDGSVSKPY